MRILHYIPSMTGGGAERQLALLASHSTSFADVHLAYSRPGPHLDIVRGSKAHLHESPFPGSRDPRNAFWLRRLMQRIRPDIVHGWLPTANIFVDWAARGMNLPVVVSERSSAASYPPSLLTSLRRCAGARADAIVANSKTGLQYWQDVEGPKLHLVIGNGIAPASPTASAAREPLILFVGRLHPDKSALEMVAGLIDALQKRPGWNATLLGEGPLRPHLEAMIEKAGMTDRILLPGYAEDPRAWMQRASLFLSVGGMEGQPNAVLEAAIERAPLLLSASAPHLELFDETSAAFTEMKDRSDLAQAIIKAIDDDGPAAVARVEKAALIAERFSVPAMVAAYADLYDRLVRMYAKD